MAYIELRRRIYHGLHSIPPNAQDAIGKRRFCRSLQTDSRQEAKRRLVPWEAHWRKLIAEATSDNPDQLAREYTAWRLAIDTASSDDERHLTTSLLTDELDDKVGAAARMAGIDPDDDDQLQHLPEYQHAVDAFKYATRQKVQLAEYLEQYLSLGGRAEKTAYQIRRLVMNLAERFQYIDDVTAQRVQQDIERRMRDGTKRGTITRDLSMLRGYWRYLERNGYAPEGSAPFDDRYIPRQNHNDVEKRQPFSADDCVRLLQAATDKGSDQVLVDLIRLGMWTGARRGELCSLKVEDVDGDFLRIGKAKTKAGIRAVPIHPKLKATVDRLCRDTTDGYLLPELLVTKNNDRGDALGKRFSTLKTAQGFNSRYVFHSFRHTVVTLLENAGVYPWVAADIVGHEKQHFTYDRYSGGNSDDPRMEAIKRIDYPRYASEAPN